VIQARTTQPVRRCACGGAVGPTGECAACRQRRLRREAAAGTGAAQAPPIVREVLNSAGRPLDRAVRETMERRFRHDFSRVRIHTDARAAESARAVGATAYTVGRDVVFDTGRYAPSASEGRRVLTHELAHVVQQAGVGVGAGSTPPIAADAAAEADAARVAADAAPRPRVVTGRRLQRLGANPACTAPQAAAIHQSIFDARGWLNKAIPHLEATPLAPAVVASLRRNFGPTYGVAANASLIVGRLRAGYHELSTIPLSCAGAGDATCDAGHCGYAASGSHAATICTNVTLATADAVFRAGCVLHESLHATFPRFTVDEYSGWHGHAGGMPTYPGAGTDPLLNADSYTTLVMDLS
jgi:hypothetical protein